MEKKVFFNTTVSESLIKQFKILAIQLSKRQNQLFEEAIQDLLRKYEGKGEDNLKKENSKQGDIVESVQEDQN
jgi:hypothetical protein